MRPEGTKKKAAPNRGDGPDVDVALGLLTRRAGSPGLLLLPDLKRPVAELVGLTDQRLLASRIPLHERLASKEQVLVGQRLEVVALQLDGAVFGLDALLNEVPLVRVGQAEIPIDLVPVVRRDDVMGLGVLWFAGGAFLQRGDRLLEVALTVVEAGQRRVDGRLVRPHLLGLQEDGFGGLVIAVLLVDVPQRKVVALVVGHQLDHLLQKGFGF